MGHGSTPKGHASFAFLNYRYVGDEVVVSWKLKKGLIDAQCIKTYFQAMAAIHIKREQYYELYNLMPTFTAAFHYGRVVVGEIGEVKSQICFIGDVMYETTEIEKNCKKLKANVLISDVLLSQIALAEIFTSKKEGTIKIPGISTISVSSITEKI